MKYIVLELFPEPHVVVDPETDKPVSYDYIDEAMVEVGKCQRGQVVRSED